MKWMFYILIVVIGTLFVGINNYFFYKNEEQQTSMQMKREAKQLHSVLLECDQFSYNCDRIMEAFIQVSSIKGKILLKKNNASIITQNLERYEDDRSSVKYSTEFQVGKNIFNLYFEKKVTPSILVSVFKSMTFSVTDWKQASLNFTSYQSFRNFISSVAMPRSRPALSYLLIISFIFGIIYIFIQYALRRWDNLEKHNKALSLQLDDKSKETRKYQDEIEILRRHSTQIASELRLTQKQLSEILRQKSLLEEQKQEVAKEIEKQISQAKTQQEDYQHQRKAEIKNLLDSHSLEKQELILEQYKIDEKYKIKMHKLNEQTQSNIDSLKLQTFELSEKLKQIDEEKQVSDLLVLELEEKLENVQKDVEYKDTQIAGLLKKINEIEVIRDKTTNQQYSLTSNKTVTEIVMRCLMKDPNLDFNPANKIIYNANDHHGNNFVTQVYKVISKKCDLTKFIKAVQSTQNQPYYRNSIILKQDFKNNNREISQYVAMIVFSHDAGYALNVILTASTQWEAVAQAKLIRLHVKSIANMPIVEKFKPA